MSDFLVALNAEKQRILSTLDPQVLAKLTHLDALIGIETANAPVTDSGNEGGDTPPTPPNVP